MRENCTAILTFSAALVAFTLGLGAPRVQAQTASNLICNACVGASDIANGAVRSGEIANSTILSQDIKDGAIKAQDIANNAITGAKILNGTVTSVDLAPALNLGTAGNDGDFTVKQAAGPVGVRLNGDNATVTNLYSNAANQSNGLVKAWAKINMDGTVRSCWRCNPDPAETRKIFAGQYEVDFTPLATDIRGRPRVMVNDSHQEFLWFVSLNRMASRDGDPSSVAVSLTALNGAGVDAYFSVVIY